MKLVGISGSLSGWKTNVVVHKVLRAAKRIDPMLDIELIDLKDYEVEFVCGHPLAYYNEDTREVVSKIEKADMLVIGTPIYQASITGALKNVLDHLPLDVFKGKVTGIVSNGGSIKHFLVTEYHLKPILTYLKGTVTTGNVFVHDDSFDDVNEIIDEDVTERIELLAKEILNLQQGLSK